MNRVESDYYDFMDFDAENARSVLSHYTQFFPEGPVLELASGPGVFLTLLRDAGIKATGVDIDEGMVVAAQRAGNVVVLDDAISHLKSAPDESLAGLFAAHFLEHLPPELVQEVYREAARVLEPQGRFVAAVPNAACMSIMGYDFWRDPTHVRFYDPVALGFFARQAGLTVTASGGNPLNHPGPPPHLRTAESAPVHPVADRIAELVRHAHVVIDRKRTGPLQQRRATADSELTENRVWGELGHIVSALDTNLQVLQHELRTTRSAYENLLAQLYPPNEVYVVAEKLPHAASPDQLAALESAVANGATQ